jgi:hypothetical protein
LAFAAMIAVPTISGMAYLLFDEDEDPRYASFLFLDGSREWAPIDIDRSVETIEAFQEAENDGLKNMILEVDTDPHARPTDDELERLWRLYKDSFESATRHGWFDYANAVRDGFYDDPGDPYHFPHREHPTDGRSLLPDQPEFLMYYPDPADPAKPVLTGFMYQQSAFDHHGEQVAGSLTRWHKHIYGRPVCFDHNLVPHGAHATRDCDGMMGSASPEMLHVWFVDRADTQFASEMSLEPDQIREPRMMSKDEFMTKHRRLQAGH